MENQEQVSVQNMSRLNSKLCDIFDKTPRNLAVILLYLAICFAEAYSSREYTILMTVTMLGRENMAAEITGWWFYFIYGAVALGVFELIMRIFYWIVFPYIPYLDMKTTRHYTRLMFCFYYTVMGLINLLCFFVPLSINLIRTAVTFLVMTACMFWLFVLISRKFVPNYLWARTLRITATVYLTFHFLHAAFNMLMWIG